jgi:hypothetical protein
MKPRPELRAVAITLPPAVPPSLTRWSTQATIALRPSPSATDWCDASSVVPSS